MAAPSAIPRPGAIAVLLSFVAGYVDTVGYVALFGLFTAHVTGNFVLIGASLAHARGGLLAKLAALPVFVLAVAATALYVRARRGQPALARVVAAQVVFLTGFALVGGFAAPITDVDAVPAVLAGLLGVCAMAIQNAASRLLMSELPPTTVMTGGVTQFAIDSTELLAGGDSSAARTRLRKFLPPILAFASGAIAGALLYTAFGFVALGLPIAALIVVIGLSRTEGASR